MCPLFFFFSPSLSSLPFTIRPPQPSPPVPPEPPAVPARREIGSERGAGILPQLTEPRQAQAALLPATSLGTGGRGAAGGCRRLAALLQHRAPQPPLWFGCQKPNEGGGKGENGREKSWLRRARWRGTRWGPLPFAVTGWATSSSFGRGHGSLAAVLASHGEAQPRLSLLVPPAQLGEPIPGMASADAAWLGDAAWRARLPQTHLLPSIRLPRRGAREIGKGRAEEGLLVMGGWFWGALRPCVALHGHLSLVRRVIPALCRNPGPGGAVVPWLHPGHPLALQQCLPLRLFFPAFLVLASFLEGEAGPWLENPP